MLFLSYARSLVYICNLLNNTNESLHVNLGFAGGLYDKDTKLTRFGYRKTPIGFRRC